jgi:hypothetical protein
MNGVELGVSKKNNPAEQQPRMFDPDIWRKIWMESGLPCHGSSSMSAAECAK